MEDKPHPVSLVAVIFTRSSVIAIQEHANHENLGKTCPGATNKINVTRADFEKGEFEVSMGCIMNPDGTPDMPYSIDMECFCLLKADMSQLKTREEASKAIMITAHSVLYGAIREAVSWITGRQPYGPLTLGLSILRPPSTEETPAAKQ